MSLWIPRTSNRKQGNSSMNSYTHKFDNLDEMDKISKNKMKYARDTLTSSVTIKKIEFVVKTPPNRCLQAQMISLQK